MKSGDQNSEIEQKLDAASEDGGCVYPCSRLTKLIRLKLTTS